MKFTVTYELAIPDWADLEERALYHEVDAKWALYAIERHYADTNEDSGTVYLIEAGGERFFDTEPDNQVPNIIQGWTWYMNDEAGHGVTLDIVER